MKMLEIILEVLMVSLTTLTWPTTFLMWLAAQVVNG